MQEGGKRTLIIPPELAYGDRGAGGIIPPKVALDLKANLLYHALTGFGKSRACEAPLPCG